MLRKKTRGLTSKVWFLLLTGEGVVSKSSYEVEEDERQSNGAGQGDWSVEASNDRTSSRPAGDRTTAAQGQTQTYVMSCDANLTTVKDQRRYFNL